MDDDFDEFFSKKDRSKKKSKKKFVAADLLPPSSSSPVPGSGEGTAAAKEASTNPTEEIEVTEKVQDLDLNETKDKKKTRKKKTKDAESKAQEDDEWNEADDTPDYTGLRIATKNIARETEMEEAGEGQTSDVDENDETRSKQASSVWSRPQVEETMEEKPPTPPVSSPVDDNPNVVSGRYVAPGRRLDLNPVSIKKQTRFRQPRIAPNIHNPDDFPTLGGPPPPADYDPTNFERVRGGGRSETTQTKPGSHRVETSNMYSALEH